MVVHAINLKTVLSVVVHPITQVTHVIKQKYLQQLNQLRPAVCIFIFIIEEKKQRRVSIHIAAITCANQPCKNGATCYTTGNSYFCFCGSNSMYTGTNCDTPKPTSDAGKDLLFFKSMNNLFLVVKF